MNMHRLFTVCGLAGLLFCVLALPLEAQEEGRGLQLLATLSANVTDVIEYGETPEGVRLDVSFEGRLRGQLRGVMRGVDYVLIRGDGVFEINVRAAVFTDDGARISAEIRGNLIDGDIRDTSVKFVTGHPDYQWLHDQIIVGKGWTDGETLDVRYLIVR